jgi:predicted transcriptional regulator
MLTTREMSIQTIADNFDVTRPAVVKHLGVLERASLVRTRRHGRERL